MTLAEASPADRRRFKAHLRAGRAHSGKQAFPAAVKEFEAALQVVPDDPHALSELGWAAFRAGDMERARAANEKALAMSADNKLKAASLYNLGRIAEQAGDVVAAIERYEKSIELRPRESVQARISKLKAAPTAAQPVAANRPDPCERPPSQDQYCRCMSEFPDDPDIDVSCSWQKTSFERLWLVTCEGSRTDLVEVRDGVWHEVAVAGADNVYEGHEVKSYSVSDSGKDVLVLAISSSFSYRTGGSYDEDVHELLCVVGASEKAATECPLRLHVKSHSSQYATEDVAEDETYSYSWTLEWTLEAGEVRLEIAEKDGRVPDLTEDLRPRRLFTAPAGKKPAASSAKPKNKSTEK